MIILGSEILPSHFVTEPQVQLQDLTHNKKMEKF